MKHKLVIVILLTVLFSSISAHAGLTQIQVSELYVTIFGRASEGEGNAHWQSQSSMLEAATEMLNTPAAKDYFGSSLNTNQAFIEHIYQNTLNKTVQQDAEGIHFWTSQLDNGISRGQVVAELIGAMEKYAPDSSYYHIEGRDAELTQEQLQALAAYHRFQNRVEVSNYMADTVWPTPADWATSTAFSPDGLNVTDDTATVDNAKRAVDYLRNITPAIELSRKSVSLEVGESTTISITGGSGNYSVVNSNTQVASTWISGSSLEIAGLSEGIVTLVVTDAQGLAADVSVKVFTCGAYVAPGVWKRFDCYNLAAIGKTTNDDPFTPSWRLIGGYWQWGRKGPSSSQWYDTNTEHFAHGPTGLDAGNANNGNIRGWDDEYAPDGAWSDNAKTVNDPCPSGFRVPTMAQWEGVIDNNGHNTIGTWDSDDTNYSSARFFGSDLMLPAAGDRDFSFRGALHSRGTSGYYWSSSEFSSDNAWSLDFYSSGAESSYDYRRNGRSVRCVADTGEASCTYEMSPPSGSFSSGSDSASVSVTASRSNCTWTTSESLSWVSLSPTSGIGSGSVTVSVDPNTGGARSGWVSIAGKTYNITQNAAACTYGISPTSGNFGSGSGNKTVSVEASSSGCTWTTSESLSWVRLSPTSGTGSGSVTVSVDPNNGAARSGSVTIAGKTYTISQSESSCTYAISPSSGSFGPDGGSRTVTVTASDSICSWTTSENMSWVSLSPTSGTGSGSVTVSVDPNPGLTWNGSVTIAGEKYEISQR